MRSSLPIPRPSFPRAIALAAAAIGLGVILACERDADDVAVPVEPTSAHAPVDPGTDAAADATPPVAEPDPDEATPRELDSAAGTYRVRYVARPAPSVNEPFDVRVRVERTSTRAPIGREVKLHFDARMPEHRHGMTVEPRVARTGEGEFLIEGVLLHMPGRWVLTFDLTDAGVTERAREVVILE